MEARFFAPEDAGDWDAFCAGAYNATFLHTRRFLSYHGDRFQDRSVVLLDGNRWLGALPAAVHPAQADCVLSHPGSSYGGIVHQGQLRGAAMLEALQACRALLAGAGYRRLQYKAVPGIYHQSPAGDDVYALFRLGARTYRCDLSSCIDLAHRLPLPERRRRGLKKAQKAGLELGAGQEHIAALWDILAANLERKHGVRPVHTPQEIALLADRFPEAIQFRVARLGGEVVAGTVLFASPMVRHAQYIAVSEAGQELHALDFLFDRCIAEAAAAGARYFDFGISTEEQGTVLNEGLYRFKSEFGASGVVHSFHELDLEDKA